MTKQLSILGSTGSIGRQALEVADVLEEIRIVGLSAGSNIDLLEAQVKKYRPEAAAVMDEAKALELRRRLGRCGTEVLSGMEGLVAVATLSAADTVLTAVTGNVGLRPTFAAIAAGKTIALANKETLVSAGELVMDLAQKHGVRLYPVDSEHSAIFQCLQGNAENPVERILLTASGGPFRGRTRAEMEGVTVEEALHHPNWSMGAKITVDSATMMNKGLEVMEARWLFGVPVERILVLVHPQSIVHSAVEFADGAVIAQMGCPDMRLPIQYALTYPKRVRNPFPRLDLFQTNTLTFFEPDREAFPCLDLAYDALKKGGTLPAVLNAANEVAVSRFLRKEIRFLDIPRLLEQTLEAYTIRPAQTLEDLLEADAWARGFAEHRILSK